MPEPIDTSHPERDAEAVTLFVEESLEGLQRVEQLLLEAEKGRPADTLLPTLFRDFHTIKGTSAYFAFNRIRSLSHSAEDLLSRLRDNEFKATREHYSCLLAVGDCLRQLIEALREGSDEGNLDVTPLVARLQASMSAVVSTAPPAAPVLASPTPTAPPPVVSPPAPSPPATPPQAAAAEAAGKDGAGAHADGADGTVRVNVAVLDRLMNLIGELVLARNQLVQMVRVSSDSSVNTQAACQRLNLVTSDLQEQIMKTRMQPVARVFEKIPRMVRDLSLATGKQVTTQIEGTGTEIDKALVEAIRDPVMHIVRNAIDHGIESPADRIAKGKPAAGKLTVRAAHEGGMVTIEVEDDGAGMDTKVLRAHAVKKQLMSATDAQKLSERETLELVFRPGFSTAEKVTDISGRGVGMDVVRTHVDRAGGQAEIESTVGKGTTIRLKMPLTLAIIPALLVRTRGQRFAIPQVNLLELVYLNEEQAKTAIEYVRGAAIHRLRGEILPIVRLGAVLGLEPPGGSDPTNGLNIVVLAVGARRYGLVVDAIHDTEEIVIKPLHGQLKRLSCYSGATVLGDGGVALILDAAGVALRSGIDLSTQHQTQATVVAAGKSERQSLLVFRSGEHGQCAVPLSMVARLEQIPTASIEHVAGSEVVQYRNTILPIVRPEAVLSLGTAGSQSGDQPLIVFDFGQPVGMAVNEILDIVSVEVEKGASQDTPYALAKVVIFNKTTLLLDVYQIVRELAPQFIQERRRVAKPIRVLLVDDSNAMRTALTGFLRSRGLEVVEASGGEAALRELRGPGTGAFDALITDLVMPGVDGFEVLAAARRERPALPAFAWTFDEGQDAADRALAVGARACVSKLKREELFAQLSNLGVGLRRAEDRRTA